ncbi:hypothetical protein [Flavilitoribacter nigricans]|uniref:Uncharacterized protein n=1 Tax=Flavilitoribacter nigricans (strain ATCC 23147 / DSM 23189 / NBRC 102662 / NCIMB 1420 / SS-2) TaxID=1122177 RepID=A0A2D0MZ85_FLAN2|nr:hypothetical protein [Flavilitoribacter nigricans]PHN01436.1 hypothetical protein CRP01_37250 [Flavilitoribacter nigricans DSM 23189 = NBRC 102662]
MKLFSLLLIAGLFCLAGNPVTDDYQYELTVETLGDLETTFDLIITGSLKADDEPVKETFIKLKTPYQKILAPGTYTIKIDPKSRTRQVSGKIRGIQNGKYRGSASANSGKILLQAGPGGSYSTGRW